MRFSRVVSATLGAFALTALTTVAAPLSHAATGEYVAMGDSYASGTGAGNYSDTACTRSRNAYPALWAAANSPASFKFVACGGAQVPDVQRNQLSALSASTQLVSISIGGNDTGFASVMLSCKYSTTSACERALADSREVAENELPGQLDALYAQIRTRAPQARVVVVGYPYLYKNGGLCIGGLSSAKRTMLNQGSDLLNGIIAGRAQAAGFVFADARPAFAGHEICTSDEWISGSNVHPTAEGHTLGYLPAFTTAAA
ncbi:lipase [Actinomadura craniellae]|uniref:Lipase n=1 Tax=Actinomadura craniellae TaxID=2231787 RepID=A0A365H6Z1_9ACTN|nr:SGNH/GDSL hydrolase family protein [Actinomadura craniellae]RAY14809.1 lipase [Actinomadura craniellae]